MKTDLAYILASSHSGSTLLAMLLGAHADACTIGEMKASPSSLGNAETYRCSCGELIRACPFWTRVSEEMRRHGEEFDVADAGTDFRTVSSKYAQRLLRPMHRGRALELARDAALAVSPTWRGALPCIQRRNAQLAAVVTELTNTRVIVDSSKIATRLKYLLRNNELNVRVVRLIRDGRAVALTYMDPARFADAQDERRRGGGHGGNRDSERLAMEQAALEWRCNNEAAEHVLAGCERGQWIEVRYEDLCTNTDRELARIFTFLNLDPDRWVREFRSVDHHVVGNGMRFDESSEIKLDTRWQKVLTAEELRTFDAIAGEMNRRYGYE